MFKINTEVVESKLGTIDEEITKLESLVKNIESDISSGWSSERSKSLVTPKIEEIKNSIEEMKKSAGNVRDNVQTYVNNVQSADAAGSLK